MSPEIVNFYNFVKKIKSTTYFSNLFYLPSQLNILYEQGRCTVLYGKDLAIVLEQDGDLQRLYYCSKNKDLNELRNLLNSQILSKVCCDVVTKENAESIDKIFTGVGMYRYSTFVKLSRKEIPNECTLDLAEVKFAVANDIEEIHNLLFSTFDKWTAHFPTDDIIAKAIFEKEILVIRRENKIVALGYFDTESVQNTCLKYYIVRDGYRGQHLAEKILFAKMMNFNKSKTYYLWVDEKNKFGLARHHKNNFFEDGLQDHIYRFV